jgi:hypothetical protein
MMRHRGLAVLGAVIAIAACGSDGGQPAAVGSRSTASTPAASTPAASAPAIPPGGTDCGTVNELSGWPTTFAVTPTSFTCIADAIANGTPARMVLISPGQHNSGRKTGDGFDIPTHHVVTWIVEGAGSLQQTTDSSEDGGPVTVENCTGLTEASFGSPPTGVGCVPA